MSFLSQLEINDKKYKILECTFDFDQPLDDSGRPSGRPRGGIILLTLEFTNETNLLTWMVSPTQQEDGKVTFFRQDGMSKMLSIEFTKAYCAKLSGYFNHTGDQPLKLRIKITAEEMNLNNVPFKNNWPVKQ